MKSDSTLEKKFIDHLKTNGVHCPFCGFTGMERLDDATDSQQGVLKQKRTCWECGQRWTLEYDLIRVVFTGQKFDRFGEITKKFRFIRKFIRRVVPNGKAADC